MTAETEKIVVNTIKKGAEISLVKQRRVDSRVNWPQSNTGHRAESAGTDWSCHCSARALVPARACQKLAVTLINTEEPHCFLFRPNVPCYRLKSPLCFMRASWTDRKKESYTVTFPSDSPGVLAGIQLHAGSHLSVHCGSERLFISVCAVFFLEAIWFWGILLILFFTVYLGLVYFANATLCKGTIRIGKSAPLFSCTERGYVKHLIGCSTVPFCYVFNAVHLPWEIITNSLYPVFASLDQMRFPASVQHAKNDRHNSELEQ